MPSIVFKDFTDSHTNVNQSNRVWRIAMNIPNTAAAIILAKVAVKSILIGAAAGSVIIAMCHKGYADGKKGRVR